MTQTAVPPSVPAQNYRGSPNPADCSFFLPPPTEIGELIAGESTLRTGMKPMALAVYWMILLLSAVPGIALMFYGSVTNFANPDERTLWWVLGGAVEILLPLATWGSTRFKHTCGYLGREGAVRYTVRGKVEARPKIESVLFGEAAELRTKTTRRYVNGVYAGTNYAFSWTDQAGRTKLKLSGSFNSQKGTPKPKSPWYFVQAAEIAWINYPLRGADEELARTGELTFHVDKKKTVVLGPGFIEFHFGGRVDRCEAGDIKSIQLQNGQFMILHRDVRWFSSKGKFGFPYGEMGNARVFLFAVERFCPRAHGIRGGDSCRQESFGGEHFRIMWGRKSRIVIQGCFGFSCVSSDAAGRAAIFARRACVDRSAAGESACGEGQGGAREQDVLGDCAVL